MIGLTIVAFATSAPEILVSIVAALRGEPDLAIGNAIGSNIANVGLVLGTVALIRPIELKSATLRREMPALLAVSLLTIALFLDSYLSRVDGFVLLTGLVIVLIWLARLGFRSSGVSEVVIGVTLVALATSLPELAVSLVSALKGEYGLAIGNIVGSNTFNLLAVIGVAGVIQPATLPPSVLSLHIFVMVAFTLVLFALTYEYDGKGKISRTEGFALLAAYIAYQAYVMLQSV
jgi:cation:H+ antiporter